VAQNYTLRAHIIPAQRKPDDSELSSTLYSIEAGMALSVLLPLGFSLFMALSLNRVWSLYLAMQLLSNLRNFRTLMIPSSAMAVLEMVDTISNYKLVD